MRIQVWLQEFAWTEDEKAAKIERRTRDGPKGRQLAKEPMFCFEFAMNMLYWSALVYDYGEVSEYEQHFLLRKSPLWLEKAGLHLHLHLLQMHTWVLHDHSYY